MEIELKNANISKFSDVKSGDLFAKENGELFVKTNLHAERNAVKISTGEAWCFSDSTKVKKVKRITVEFE